MRPGLRLSVAAAFRGLPAGRGIAPFADIPDGERRDGQHRYTVIYKVRLVEQVVNSQWTMLARSGQKPRSEKQHLIDVQEAHSRQIRDVLQKSDRVTLLEVSLPELVADPQPQLERLTAVLEA